MQVPPASANPVPAQAGATVTAPAQAAATATAAITEAIPEGEPIQEKRGLFEDVSIEEPLDALPTISANVVSWFTGTFDTRHGTAATRVALAGERVAKSVLTHMGRGASFLARSASFLGRAMPVLNIGFGAMQASRGWDEVKQAEGSLLERMLASRDVRGGVLQAVAGAALLVTGPVGWMTSAGLMVAAAANDLDVFSFLDRKDPAEPASHPAAGQAADGAALTAGSHPA